jgi:septum site-determining protein MinD
MGIVVVVTSGKGGTGKTSLSAGVGVALAEMGRRVLCIDADVGLRNLDISLGMTDTALMDFSDVTEGRCTLSRAVAPHPGISNLFLLTAPLTLTREAASEEAFRALLDEARATYEYILIDAPAGLGMGFRLAVCGADEGILVSMSDSSALRDAQRVVASLGSDLPRLHLVMNRVQPKMLKKLGSTIDDAMDSAGLPLLGLVPEDPYIVLCANSGRVLLKTRRGGAALAYRNIAKRMTGTPTPLMKIK